MQQIICTWNDYCKAKGKEVVSKKKKVSSEWWMKYWMEVAHKLYIYNPNH
jgi:hypothetical protein